MQSIILFVIEIWLEFLIFVTSFELYNKIFAELELTSTKIKKSFPHDKIGTDKLFDK